MRTKVFLISLLGLIISCSSPSDKKKTKEKLISPKLNRKLIKRWKNRIKKLNGLINMFRWNASVRLTKSTINRSLSITNSRLQTKRKKDVESMRGKITFTNKKGNEIKSFTMTYAEPIEAGEKVIWNAETAFDQFMDNEEALKNLELIKLDCYWEPLQISFADGSVIE